jgi:hypothetical protein
VNLLRLENGGGDFGPRGFRLAGTGVSIVDSIVEISLQICEEYNA